MRQAFASTGAASSSAIVSKRGVEITQRIQLMPFEVDNDDGGDNEENKPTLIFVITYSLLIIL